MIDGFLATIKITFGVFFCIAALGLFATLPGELSQITSVSNMLAFSAGYGGLGLFSGVVGYRLVKSALNHFRGG